MFGRGKKKGQEGYGRVDRSTPKTLEHAGKGLGLNDAQLERMRSDANEVIERLGSTG